jgi:hypothetical protein
MGGWTLSAQRITDEFRLKAAVLFKLAQFVDWPAPAPSTAAQSTCACRSQPSADSRSPCRRRVVEWTVPCRARDDRRRPWFLPRLIPSQCATMRKATLERIGHVPILTVATRLSSWIGRHGSASGDWESGSVRRQLDGGRTPASASARNSPPGGTVRARMIRDDAPLDRAHEARGHGSGHHITVSALTVVRRSSTPAVSHHRCRGHARSQA